MSSAKRCVHIVCELSEMLFPFTAMNWEEKTSGWNGKVKLNYSCAVYKCENIIYNEHIPISTLRSPLRASSFQWFLRAEWRSVSSALCVLRFGSLCFLCICPVPARNVVTAARDTAGMTMSLMIYMKWFVNSTYKYSFPLRFQWAAVLCMILCFLSPSVMPSKSWASPCWLKMRCTHLRT